MRVTTGFLAAASLLSAGVDAASITVGDVRVSALSASLLRVEQKGPTGFEDRATMNIVGRDSFPGLAISELNTSATGTWLATTAYHVFVPKPAASPPPSAGCPAVMAGTDGNGVVRSPTYPNGTHVASPSACCALCKADAECQAWVAEDSEANDQINCWPLASSSGTKPHAHRSYGRVRGGQGESGLNKGVVVATPAGGILYRGTNTGDSANVAANLLHWPSPLNGSAYAFNDYPRFTVPRWGPTPIPAGSNVPASAAATNGYDFTNSVDGDTYVFLLGDTLDGWWAGRRDFLTLTGPTPLLPDFAYGIWYTWYIAYTEQRAKDEIGNWTAAKLPLDVWGLDMNWRMTGVGEGTAPATSASIKLCKTQVRIQMSRVSAGNERYRKLLLPDSRCVDCCLGSQRRVRCQAAATIFTTIQTPASCQVSHQTARKMRQGGQLPNGLNTSSR